MHDRNKGKRKGIEKEEVIWRLGFWGFIFIGIVEFGFSGVDRRFSNKCGFRSHFSVDKTIDEMIAV